MERKKKIEVIVIITVLTVLVLIANAGLLIATAVDNWLLVLAGLVVFTCFLYRVYTIRVEEAHGLWSRTRDTLTRWLEEFMGGSWEY